MNRSALWPPLAWLVVFLAIPTLVIGVYSFAGRTDLGGLRPEFSTDGWRTVLTFDTVRMFGRSFWIAAAATLGCLALAYPVAYHIVQCGPRVRGWLLALVVLPFWTNFLARNAALKLMLWWTSGVHPAGNGAVILGLIYSYLPFMVLPLYVSIEKLPRRVLEAAADLGAGPARRFWTVTVPLTAPGIAAGCLLVFVPCLGAFVTPALLGNPNQQMLGMQIDQYHHGDVPASSALSLVMMGLVLALLGIYYRLKKTEGVV